MRKILVADDLSMTAAGSSRSTKIRQLGEALAETCAAKGELVTVAPDTRAGTMPTQVLQKLQKENLRQKTRLARIARAHRMAPRFATGDPHQVLSKCTGGGSGYSLAVFGTRGHAGIARAILGSVVEEVIRQSKIPIAVLGPKTRTIYKPGVRELRSLRVLVCAGGDKADPNFNKILKLLASKYSVEARFFHVLFENLHPVMQTAFASQSGQRQLSDYFETQRAAGVRRLRKLAEVCSSPRIRTNVQVDTFHHSAAQGALKEIKKYKPDLVITGTHRRKFIVTALIGSTTRELILNSPVPTIVLGR